MATPRCYHNGKFQTLDAVVDHYDLALNPGLPDDEKRDLVEHLRSL